MKSCIILLFTFVFSGAFSQEGWKNYFQSDDLEINYRAEDCHDHANDVHKRLIFFQFVNKTAQTLTITFNKEQWFGDRCINCEDTPENRHIVRLTPQQTLTPNCEEKLSRAYYIFDKMLKQEASKLSRFELKNIQVFKAGEK